MKIAVLNGSPKGKYSVTLQYARFLGQHFPDHDFSFIEVASGIKTGADNTSVFNRILAEVEAADAVIWTFPLYFLLVHSQYKRFIEMVFEQDAAAAFRDKYAAAITTSIHYYDHTAANYIRDISEDLGMRFTDTFTAHMYDLTRRGPQKQLAAFAEDFLSTAAAGAAVSRQSAPLQGQDFRYVPGETAAKADNSGLKILLLHDITNKGSNLHSMVKRFHGAFHKDIEVVNLHELDIRGACRGCIQCGPDNTCFYEGSDGYTDFYREKVEQADIIVFAGTIVDRYLSSRWKLFFDRSFFNTHRPVLRGKQFAYIISGPLRQLPNLRQIFEAYTQMQQANLAGIVSDEDGDNSLLDALLDGLAARVVTFQRAGYVKPIDFLGVGGHKLFRDEVWGNLRFPFIGDHRTYKKIGYYDFPKLGFKRRLKQQLMINACRSKGFRKELNKKMIAAMVAPFRRVLGEK